MSKSTAGALLRLESDVLLPATTHGTVRRELFVSVNPDLISDFGHYLNYEKRLAEVCRLHGLDHVCLASRHLSLEHPGIVGTFMRDSGYYAMTRASARDNEDSIAADFRDVLLEALAELPNPGSYMRTHVFVYCGSSRLAVRLAGLTWPEGLNICINAFWDFLLDEATRAELPRIHFQRSVHLLAMSDLHAKRWQESSGLYFDGIPNPPPLLSDRDACDAIRESVGATRTPGPLQVLLPGLMSMGKGRESTQALLDHLRQHGTGGCEYVIRDRKCELVGCDIARVRILTGDLSDAQVMALYRDSDIVLLPYEAEVFAVRTSGALVDALLFGAVPLVLEGTWLAHQCRLYETGNVLPDAQPRTIVDAVAAVGSEITNEQHRMPRAAALYLADNTWSKLLQRVTRPDGCGKLPPARVGAPAASLFAAANSLLRAGHYSSAARLYALLQKAEPLAVYASNLELCVRRSGRQSIEELLSTHP